MDIFFEIYYPPVCASRKYPLDDLRADIVFCHTGNPSAAVSVRSEGIQFSGEFSVTLAVTQEEICCGAFWSRLMLNSKSEKQKEKKLCVLCKQVVD